MSKKPVILGIESSCDETAVALIRENNKGEPEILSNIVSSQVDIHKEFGGVVPELAARAHIEKIDLISKKALDKAIKRLEDSGYNASRTSLNPTGFRTNAKIKQICDILGN